MLLKKSNLKNISRAHTHTDTLISLKMHASSGTRQQCRTSSSGSHGSKFHVNFIYFRSPYINLNQNFPELAYALVNYPAKMGLCPVCGLFNFLSPQADECVRLCRSAMLGLSEPSDFCFWRVLAVLWSGPTFRITPTIINRFPIFLICLFLEGVTPLKFFSLMNFPLFSRNSLKLLEAMRSFLALKLLAIRRSTNVKMLRTNLDIYAIRFFRSL